MISARDLEKRLSQVTAERGTARAEAERLREVLRDIATLRASDIGYMYIDEHSASGHAFKRVQSMAIASLKHPLPWSE